MAAHKWKKSYLCLEQQNFPNQKTQKLMRFVLFLFHLLHGLTNHIFFKIFGYSIKLFGLEIESLKNLILLNGMIIFSELYFLCFAFFPLILVVLNFHVL